MTTSHEKRQYSNGYRVLIACFLSVFTFCVALKLITSCKENHADASQLYLTILTPLRQAFNLI